MSGDVPFGFRPEDPEDPDASGDAGSGGSSELPEGSGPGSEPGGSGGAGGGPGFPGGFGAGSGSPFGFGGEGGNDPFSALFGALGGQGGTGGGNPMDLGAALQQLGKMMSWQGGPVNWDLAHDAARQAVAASGDVSVSGPERRDVEDAVRLADVWLDPASAFPASSSRVRAWSRAEWVEGTIEGWKALVEPVAERVVDSMGKALPEEVGQMAGPLMGMMRQLGVSMWGGQVGQAIGSLATEVVGSTDIGLPLVEPGLVVLLPQNIRAFGQGLGVDARDTLLYLALRESARQRLFTHAPWLRSHLVGLVDAFARGITVDTSRIEEAMRTIDPQRPEGIQEALESGMFEPQTTEAQQGALDRLETALALVEGWVDDVVTQATADRMSSATALRETVRRQRATGGPAEQTFATLVGLELRPRRLREASVFWAAVREARGLEGRDALWAHPDLMPDGDALSDPQAYLAGEALFDLSGLDELAAGPAHPGVPGEETAPGEAAPEADAGPDPEAGPDDAGGTDEAADPDERLR